MTSTEVRPSRRTYPPSSRTPVSPASAGQGGAGGTREQQDGTAAALMRHRHRHRQSSSSSAAAAAVQAARPTCQEEASLIKRRCRGLGPAPVLSEQLGPSHAQLPRARARVAAVVARDAHLHAGKRAAHGARPPLAPARARRSGSSSTERPGAVGGVAGVRSRKSCDAAMRPHSNRACTGCPAACPSQSCRTARAACLLLHSAQHARGG